MIRSIRTLDRPTPAPGWPILGMAIAAWGILLVAYLALVAIEAAIPDAAYAFIGGAF